MLFFSSHFWIRFQRATHRGHYFTKKYMAVRKSESEYHSFYSILIIAHAHAMLLSVSYSSSTLSAVHRSNVPCIIIIINSFCAFSIIAEAIHFPIALQVHSLFADSANDLKGEMKEKTVQTRITNKNCIAWKRGNSLMSVLRFGRWNAAEYKLPTNYLRFS